MAGVSVGTVDRVIHNRGKVSDDARIRVEEILDQTGYQPNLLARTLGSNKKHRIVVLIPNPEVDEYWELCNSGIIQAKSEWAHYNVEIQQIYFDLYHEEFFSEIAEKVLENTPDGVLVAPIFFSESKQFLECLRAKNIPFILFNTDIPESRPLSFIGQDLYQSGHVAAELLNLGKGKKRIAVLHVLEDIANSVHLRSKEEGLRDYFEEINAQGCLVQSFDLSNPDLDCLGSQILKILDSDEWDGIFISTSKGTHIAASVIQQSSFRHIRLVGYDLLKENIEMLKMGTIDFLINQNPKRQAQLGISYLVNYLMFNRIPPDKGLFPLEIITRQNLGSYTKSLIH